MHTQRKGARSSRGGRPSSPYRRALFGLALVASLAWALPLTAQSTAFEYAAGRCVIKAAALSPVLSDPGPPPIFAPVPTLGTDLVADPGLMEGLRRASFRPARWDIVNPRGGTGAAGAYVPEGSPAYWQVGLAPGAHTDLSGFDLLYICYPDVSAIDDFQLNSLLEAVAEGAVLWIDLIAGMAPPPVGPAWPIAPFSFTPGTGAGGMAVPDVRCVHHALIARPFRLSIAQVAQVGDPAATDRIDSAAFPEYLHPVLRDTNGDVVVSAGRYGSGGFVVTARQVGVEIAVAPGLPDRAMQAPDVMFAYNVMAWATAWSQSRQSARGAGASVGEVRADLDVKWQTPPIDMPHTPFDDRVGPVAGAPVIDDAGREFLVTYGAAPTLYCFDSDPAQDIDGDSLADDGEPDYLGGSSPDRIWSFALPQGQTPGSTSPATATALIGGNPVDVVLVSSCDPSAGPAEVACFDAAIGGAPLWVFTAEPYGGAGAGAVVTSISTPVVHSGYVYVLVSEYAAGATGGPPENDTYGRVHCFDLATGNTLAWVYPDHTLVPAGVPQPVQLQHQMALPPIDDPTWVSDNPGSRPELPPIPTPVPSVGNSAHFRAAVSGDDTTFDPHLDAVVYFGTPVSKAYDPAVPGPVTVTWGSDFAVVPAPPAPAAPAPDPFASNRSYYRILHDVPGATAAPATTYVHPDGTETSPYAGAAPDLSFDPYAQYPEPDVRSFLAGIPNDSPSTPYVDVQTGCSVLARYTAPAGIQRDELDFLPGPVLFKRPHQGDTRRASGQSIAEEVLTGAVTIPVPPPPDSGYTPGQSGGVAAFDPATGETRWTYDPRTYGLSSNSAPQVWVDAAPADADSAILGAASRLISPTEGHLSQAFALDPRPDVTVRIRVPIPGGHSDPPSVQLASHTPPQVWLADGSAGGAWPGALPIVDPSCYKVDYENRRITFPAATAHNVRAPDGLYLGPVYGRMLVISYAYDANDPVTPGDPTDDATMDGEVYSVPDLARWRYQPGLVQLRHHPVAWSGAGVTPIACTLANGVAVAGFVPAENLVTVNNVDWLPTGRLDLTAATYGLAATPVQRGAELVFAYDGMSPDGPVAIPNAYESSERRQVPYSFGRTIAPVAAASDGQTAVMGTESFDLQADGDLDSGPDVGGYAPGIGPAPDPGRTLLALGWDKVTDQVTGRLVRPAYEPPVAAGNPPRVPIVSGSAAVDGDTVHVGSRVLSALPDSSISYGGIPEGGYASALSPARTLVTDNERIMETVGSQIDWVCTGIRALDGAYANAAAAQAPGFPNNVPISRWPFSRPAKAVRLTEDDFLTTYPGPGGLERCKVPVYPPEAGGPLPPGVPAGTTWPPPESGVGPGNYLVVDTGNNRVVEIDRKGQVVWPLLNYLDAGGAPVGTRRPKDGLGFESFLEVSDPTDAHRFMEWNPNAATPRWEMHTVVADSGHYRVIDIITTFDLDATTGGVLQTHALRVVTPSHVYSASGPRAGEHIRVGYTRAQPLFDPNNGQLIGYLCAANNLHEVLVIDAGDGEANPPPAKPLPSGSGGTWAMWSWLYDRDLDIDPETDERLIFENIRHVSAAYNFDQYGDPYIFVTVVCGRYRGPRAFPYTLTGVAGNPAGAACVEFRIGPIDPGNTGTWALRPANDDPSQWYVPYWYYTDRDYEAGPAGHLYIPGNPNPQPKAFWPTCAQRLLGGRHVVANYAGVVENLVHPNVPTATDFGTPPSLGSDVIEIQTHYTTPNDPATQVHAIDVHKVIPDPWNEDWSDPFNQPSFVQRTQDSLVPLRP